MERGQSNPILLYAMDQNVHWEMERKRQLATYLGHVHITGTQHYLAMTPELLRQASLRFELFALGGSNHA